jgi:uroporphyrinogen-III synthase
MSSPSRKLFVLFRGSDSKHPDEYLQFLSEHNFDAISVRALSFQFIHESELVGKLINFDQSYSALIITSPRVCELINVLIERNHLNRETLSTIAMVAVGPKSHELANHLGFANLITNFNEINNAAELANAITQSIDLNPVLCNRLQSKPILMPSSDIGREELVALLAPKGIQVEKFVCYQTKSSTKLKNDLIQEFRNYLQLNEIEDFDCGIKSICDQLIEIRLHFIMFSPSGVKSVQDQIDFLPLNQIKWIAIGPTTRNHLQSNGFKVEASACQPTPMGLLTAIQQID